LRGKHGIEEAGPGRGRGGGLERVGVEVPQVRKGRKKQLRQKAVGSETGGAGVV